MSDKDIKECEFDCVEGGYCYLGYVKLIPEFEDSCKDNPSCYYKQLRTKEQECEELKEKNIDLDNGFQAIELSHINLENENTALQKQVDDLNEVVKIAQQMSKGWNEFDPINESYIENLQSKNNTLLSEKQILIEGLEEISEISGRSEDVEIIDQFGDIKILGLARYENRVIYAEYIAKQTIGGE